MSLKYCFNSLILSNALSLELRRESIFDWGDTVVLIVDGIRLDKGFEFESNGICSRRGRVIAEMGFILVVLGASW